MRPPFANNRLRHTPAEGELLLFPSWLVHGVSPSCDARGPRIALSFNLLGPASSEEARIDPAAAMGIPDWALLADSTAVMGGG